MHRLVQAVTLAHLPEADRYQRTVDAVELLAELFPYDGQDPSGWPRCAQLLAHAQAAFHHAHTMQLSSPALSQLLSRTGRYLWGRRLDVRLARELHEEALAMRQQLYDGDDKRVAESLRYLALDLQDLGEPARARVLEEQALAMYQRLYQVDHPDLARTLNNLANTLRVLGEPERAQELDEQALAMYRRLFEGDHPNVARSLRYLAADLRALGEAVRAQELEEEALAMRRRLAD
jgi:tetratricopeptide (TPR) repeat protein